MNKDQTLLDAYAKEHPENYYYLDVYSTVNFMEKMFEDVDNSQKNYDLLGGWICHSPLQAETMKGYVEGVSEKETESLLENVSIADALLLDNFYFVAAKSRDVTFVEEFYGSTGRKILLQLTDTIGEGENSFLVYQVIEK